jgi:hypothetical protein
MLVRYRMNSLCTLENMQADIDAIIQGTATFNGSGVPTNLSAGCDTANSIKYGTYPTAKYAKVGTGATANGATSSIAGTVLTVGGSVTGTFAVGMKVTGTGVAVGTSIVALGTGTGGAGTYVVSISQSVSSTNITGNPMTDTFSKIHNDYGDVTHYFRLAYGHVQTATCSAATISGTTLTIPAAINTGKFIVGMVITGTGISANTTITAYGTGTGGYGTYTVSVSQTVSTATAITGSFTDNTGGSTASSISGTTLTVGGVVTGEFIPGMILTGTGVTANTTVVSQLTGTVGQAGTYQVSASQTVSSTAITAVTTVTLAQTGALTSMTLAKSYTSGTDTLVNAREINRYKDVGQVQGTFNGTIFTANYATPLLNDVFGKLLLGNGIQAGDVFTSSYHPLYNTGYELSNTELTGRARILSSTAILSQLTGTSGLEGTYSINTVNFTGATHWQVFRPESHRVSMNVYNAQNSPYGIDIIVSTKLIYISSPYSGSHVGIFDIGKNGVGRIYTDNMLMAGIDMRQEVFGATIPYTYKFNTNTYGAQTGLGLSSISPTKEFNSSFELVVIENPVFMYQEDNGNVASVVYGIMKLPENTYGSSATYTDGSAVRRLTINDYAILTE